MNNPSPRSFPTRTVLLPAAALALAALATSPEARAQGCVAVKQMGDHACSVTGLAGHEPSRWRVDFNYQYFRSDRHFVGREEQKHRQEQNTQVINRVNQVTTTVTYDYSRRTSFSVNVPYFHAVRSSLYEHDRANRYETRSQGLGDVIIGAQTWLVDPISEPRGNFAFGLGLKLPTGESNLKDTFHTTNGPVRRNVDQSIQPGDGGWGVALSGQWFRRIGQTTSLYGSAFYLIAPQETSGTYRSNDPIIGRFSIADQYQARLGFTQVVSGQHGLTASLGGRIEGIPSNDLVGGDRGFRRPGYSISIEPGLALMTGRSTFALSVPIAVEHNRVRSFADKMNGRHGDAAFADFLVNFSYGYRW